jgi:hypothetical protein
MVTDPAPRIIPENADISPARKSSSADRAGLLQHIKDIIPQTKSPGSHRKVVAAVVGFVLIIVIIGVLAVYAPGLLHSGSENSTTSGLASTAGQGAVLADTSGSSAGNTKSSPAGTQMPAINQAVSVTTDTFLNVTST